MDNRHDNSRVTPSDNLEGSDHTRNIYAPSDRHAAVPDADVVQKENIEFDQENPNIARAIPGADYISDPDLDPDRLGTYPAIVEGSDSVRTGTSWGVEGVGDAPTVETPRGLVAEGEDPGEAHPNRNTGERPTKDELRDVGAWSTMKTEGSPGSPTGNS